MWFYRFFIIFILWIPLDGEALKIRFPDEELARESVWPVFQPSFMILNRNVSLKKRLELGFVSSISLDEPFYFPVAFTSLVSFYFTEAQGIHLSGTFFVPSYSAAGKALSMGEGLDRGQTFDVLKIPYPQAMGFLNYQYTPFYGKISLTKNFIMNLSIYGFIGPGAVVFNDSTFVPSGNFGIGQKLYFNKWLALRWDLGAYGYYGPASAKIDLKSGDSISSYRELQETEKSFIINLVTSVGLVFLI